MKRSSISGHRFIHTPRVFVLIAYDITDDRRRARLARLLEGWGERKQDSLFECCLGLPDLRDLQECVRRIIHNQEDTVRYYRLCKRDVRETQQYGQAEGFVRQSYLIV